MSPHTLYHISPPTALDSPRLYTARSAVVMETLRIGLGSSPWKMSMGQCSSGRALAIGRRHLTSPPPRLYLSRQSIPTRDESNRRIHTSIWPPQSHRSSICLPPFLNRRYNSSNTPSKPVQTEKPTTTTTLSDPSQTASQTASTAPSTSLLSRFTSLISLKGSQTTGETGYSSVAKLVELAKPEKKQLAMAVGLVRLLLICDERNTDCVVSDF
jgi:hypothetical protein